MVGFGSVWFGKVWFRRVRLRLGRVGLVGFFIYLPKQPIQACPELGPVAVPACFNLSYSSMSHEMIKIEH